MPNGACRCNGESGIAVGIETAIAARKRRAGIHRLFKNLQVIRACAHINADGGGKSGDRPAFAPDRATARRGYPRSKIPYLPARARRRIYLIGTPLTIIVRQHRFAPHNGRE